MALIRSVRGVHPCVGEEVFLAESCTLIGDVVVGNQASLWYQVVVRGDVHSIRIGDRTNIQDQTVIHATFETASTEIQEDVTIGHACILHGCIIERGSLIGMGSIVMDGARIGEYSIVGAGSLVTESKSFPPYSLIMGRPAVFKRSLTEDEITMLKQSPLNYLTYKGWYESSET
jgi:gamma-carbonic anhydrase